MEQTMQKHRNRIYRVEGVILARRDWGEADRLLTILTPDRGKLRVIAPGARKPSSRKSGHLELFTRGGFVMARGRTFDKLTQAETHDYFPLLREELERVSAAYLLVELVDRFLQEHDENPLLYDLLLDALAWLDQGEPPALVLRFFEIKMLGYVGFQPQLFECQLCGNDLEAMDQHFGVVEGGAICPSCQPHATAPLPMSLDALKVLRLMQRVDWNTARRLRMEEPLANELEWLLHRYAAFQLERDLKSVRFMDQVRRLDNVRPMTGKENQ
jgi:DNA repair protein RecO (recombination protein O)